MDYIKKIFYSEFFKNTATLLSGNIISQIIALIAYLILTRVYEPASFGIYSLYISIIAILSIISTGRYESAIVLPKEENKAISLFQLCFVINSLFFILFSLIAFFLKDNIVYLLKRDELNILIPLIPFVVFLSSSWQILNFFFVRHKKYKNISLFNLTQSCTSTLLKYLLGIKNMMNNGLLLGHIAGLFISIITSILGSKEILKNITKFNKYEILEVAKKYSNYPKYQLPHNLLNTFAGNLPILLLSLFFSMSEIGLFSLSITMGLIPATMLSYSISQVLYQKISEKVQNKNNIQNYFYLFCKFSLIFILPIFIGILFIPENFFVFLLGKNWFGVGLYLKILLPWIFSVIIVASLSFIPDIFFKQKTSMKLEILYVILRASSLLIGIYYNNIKLAVLLFSIISTLMMAYKLFWYFQLIKKYEYSLSYDNN